MHLAHVKYSLMVENRRRVGREAVIRAKLTNSLSWKYPHHTCNNSKPKTTLTPSLIPDVLTVSLLWNIILYRGS